MNDLQKRIKQISDLQEDLIRDISKKYRRIFPEDFKHRYSNIKAMFFNLKGNQYLENGEWYYLRYMEKRNKVSVPASCNPTMKCNQGVEFSLSNFYIPIEEEENGG